MPLAPARLGLYWARLAGRPVTSLPHHLTVSVIVTTRNEAEVVADVLQSISDQTYSPLETLVIDNASTDATCEIVRRFPARLFDCGPERSAQRNFGLRQASGAYALLLDADMQLTPKVIEECVEQVHRDPALTALTIPEESFGQGFWSACKALERSCYRGDSTIEGVRFVERGAALDCGGYDVRLLGGEDWDFAQRLRKHYVTGRIDATIRHNERTLTLRKAAKKKFYYASTYAHSLRLHRGLGLQQGNLVLRPAYFRSWRKLIRHPFLLIGMIVLRFTEMLAASVGLLSGLMRR